MTLLSCSELVLFRARVSSHPPVANDPTADEVDDFAGDEPVLAIEHESFPVRFTDDNTRRASSHGSFPAKPAAAAGDAESRGPRDSSRGPMLTRSC